MIGICRICGNESILTKDKDIVCEYCLEYYESALKYGDLEGLMRYISIRDNLLEVRERRGSLENVGKFEGKIVLRCVNCGAFQYSTDSLMCSCCGESTKVSQGYYYTAGGYICKSCLQLTNEPKEVCKGCLDLTVDKRRMTKFMNSYVGRVYNNLQIVKQYRTPRGILCDLKCLWMDCNEVYTGIPLYDVVNARVYCKSNKEFMSVYCDGCGSKIRLNNTEAYSRNYKCKTCGDDIGLNLRLYANDAEKYTKFKVQYLIDTFGYDKEIKNGALIKATQVSGLYQVAPIWNTRHLLMDLVELENHQFRLGGKVGDGFFSTDVIWGI